MESISNYLAILKKASKKFCNDLACDIEKNQEDTLRNTRCTLLSGEFYLYEDNLWVDGDLWVDKSIIIKGDLIINGFLYHTTDTTLIVLGDVRCYHLESDSGISVWGDLIIGGFSFQHYNDWFLEVAGTLSVYGLLIYDKSVIAGTWCVDNKGELNDDAEAVCQLLGYTDGDPFRNEALSEALEQIEMAKEHKEEEQVLCLSESDLHELPQELFDETWIEELDISNNNIKFLPERICNLKKLKKLNIAGNSLTSLPKSMNQLCNLEVLKINSNLLTHLPDSVCQLSKLKKLKLCKNQLVEIPKEIAYLNSLEKLDLSHNQLTFLPNSIGSLKNLISLNLGYNYITFLPRTMSQLGMLKNLILYFNPIADQFVPPEEMGLANNPQLFLPKVLDRLSQSDHTHLTLDNEKTTHDRNSIDLSRKVDNKSVGLPPFPVFDDIYDMYVEHHEKRKHFFVIPLPSLEKLTERWGEDCAWRKRLWYPDRDEIKVTSSERKYLSNKGSNWLYELIISKHLPADEFEQHLYHKEDRIRWALAASFDCPKNCLEVLAKDNNTIVRAAATRQIQSL
jgi:hypothetical protein